MLEGIDPVLVFQFKKNVSSDIGTSDIPTTTESSAIDLPLIPVYLSGSLTGILIDGEEKNIDIETDTETTDDGGSPKQKQRGLNSTVRISLKAEGSSVGATLLSALMDQVFEKVTSKEYSITYVHGPITVFNALLHSYAVSVGDSNDLQNITLELTSSTVKKEVKTSQPQVSAVRGSAPL